MPFDPSKPFESDAPQVQPSAASAPAKGGFDPSRPFTSDSEVPPPSALATFGKSVVSGLTSGLSENAPKLDVLPSEEQANPLSAAAGNLIGSGAQALALPEKALIDFGSGAVQGYMAGQGQPLGERFTSAALSGAANVAAPRILGKVFKVGKAAIETVGRSLERSNLGLTNDIVQQLAKKGRKEIGQVTEDAAQTLKKAGIFDKGTDPQAVHARALELYDQSGRQLDQIYKALDDSAVSIDTRGLVQDIEREINGPLKKLPSYNASEINSVNKAVSDLSMTPTVAPSVLRGLAQQLGDKAFGKGSEVVDPVAFDLWTTVKDAIDGLAKQVPGQLGSELRTANKLNSTLQRTLPRMAKNVTGDQTGGVTKQVTKQIVEKPASTGIRYTADWLEQNSAKLGKYGNYLKRIAGRGPSSLGATIYVLQQQDPEFRKALKEADDGQE